MSGRCEPDYGCGSELLFFFILLVIIFCSCGTGRGFGKY